MDHFEEGLALLLLMVNEDPIEIRDVLADGVSETAVQLQQRKPDNRRVGRGQDSIPPIYLATGLLQGSILSPSLYALFIDSLPERCPQHSGIKLETTTAAAFLYADDIALIADKPGETKRLLEAVVPGFGQGKRLDN